MTTQCNHKIETCSDLVSFPFSLGYHVSFVRKLMQVNIELLFKPWLFMLHFFAFKHAITRLTKASLRQISPVKQRLHLSNAWFSFAELKRVEIVLICVFDFLWKQTLFLFLKLHVPDCMVSACVSVLSPLPWVYPVCLLCWCLEPPRAHQLFFSSRLL